MGKKRRQRGEAYWRQALRKQRRSQQAVRAFCDDEGLAASSFYRWQRRLKEPVGVPARFAPVVVVEDGRRPGPERLEIETPGGYRIAVPAGFDEVSLERVLAVLRRGER